MMYGLLIALRGWFAGAGLPVRFMGIFIENLREYPLDVFVFAPLLLLNKTAAGVIYKQPLQVK